MKMNEQSQQDEERENLSGSDDYEAYQNDLPEHKRDGFAERLAEIADDQRKRLKEKF